jgi:periplasmic protein CpxP/Spy
MKGTTKLALVGLPFLVSVVGTVNPALAQSADTDRDDETVASARSDSMEGAEAQRHDPVAFAQKRLARLKSKLKITPEQEAQWSAFSDTVLQQMEQFKASHQGSEASAQTAPERIDRQVARMKQRVAAFEKVGEAAKTLYAGLSPEQQQIADEKLLRWHARRGS